MHDGHAVRSSASTSLLRVFVGGSEGDGKSSLIDRLMNASGAVGEDLRASHALDPARSGASGSFPNFVEPFEGLAETYRQGVSYRRFATPLRSFIVADTPTHESYTRNVAIGAANADVAVIVVDARRGLLAQTRHHAAIAYLVGVRRLVLAVNKLDLMHWDRATFQAVADAFRVFAGKLARASVVAIPLSARDGDNVTAPSENTPWYDGPTLVSYLETIDVDAERRQRPLRLPVQSVQQPESDQPLHAGTIAGGTLRQGDTVQVAISGQVGTVDRILVNGVETEDAQAGDPVAIALAGRLDVGAGDVLCSPDHRPDVTDQIAAHLVWMGDRHLVPGRSYLLKIGARTVPASVTEIKHRLTLDTLQHEPAETLERDDIGVCNIATTAPIAVDPVAESPETGRFVLIDRFTNATIAIGMVDFALRRGANIMLQSLSVTKPVRSALKGHRPCILWFTGLSGAGKSTIANLVESRLSAMGCHTYLLDGDNIRHGLNKDLGFTENDRVENIRRVGEVARLFVDSGMIVLCSFISPFRAERATVRALVDTQEFVEIFVSAPLEICEARDPKGLYAKSRAGKLPNFTGIDSPYEPPERADLVLDTATTRADDLAQRVIDFLTARGIVGGRA